MSKPNSPSNGLLNSVGVVTLPSAVADLLFRSRLSAANALRLIVQPPADGRVMARGGPTFDRQTKSLLLLGENNSPVPRLVKPSEFDAPCSTVTLGALGTPSS
ncbi:hypothetical protein BN1723_013033 [Verticillium longisporum]|uniref:Uncharacterized protein n=1 Tax=Verticillium longisporum TaxID=100787 RepID=A0A0G4LNH3_VERLO|nr:hypothetical protein BN1723_013033 [Verticillium longisporum]